METQFNFKFSNQSAPVTAWVSEDQSYMVIIPQALRNIVFTKMFMLNGEVWSTLTWCSATPK
jgi:cytochrome c peroxidase